MEFFTSAIGVLQTLVIALGGGLCIWGGINLLEGYGNDNPGANAHDAPKYCATIETVQVKKDEVVFTGEIPARCIQAYRTDLAFYTNGQSVCLTELKGYQAAVGKPVIQPRRPNSRLDKVRYMFQKIM